MRARTERVIASIFTVWHICIAWTMPSQDVRPSHAGILSTLPNISSKFFHHQVVPPF